MSTTIQFGTDGWRGVIAEDYTFDSVRRAAQGFASYLQEQGKKGEWVVVGHDMGFGSENFAAAAAEVLAGNGRVDGGDGGVVEVKLFSHSKILPPINSRRIIGMTKEPSF
ncbi:MAG: hypothetical protein QMD04_01295 [Anaerolineales bacterium]|nr:hypothetical protein [Anaerolineales bacterium]